MLQLDRICVCEEVQQQRLPPIQLTYYAVFSACDITLQRSLLRNLLTFSASISVKVNASSTMINDAVGQRA